MNTRHATDTGKQLLATGNWAKSGKNYVHVSGVAVTRDNGRWVVGKWTYSSLWAAAHAVEIGNHKQEN